MDVETALYVCKGSLNLIALYVDDLIKCGVMEAVDNMKQQLFARHKMKDLGIIHRILGCAVLYDEHAGTFSINQSKYIKFVCNKFLPSGGATVQTPMSGTTLSKEMKRYTQSKILDPHNVPN